VQYARNDKEIFPSFIALDVTANNDRLRINKIEDYKIFIWKNSVYNDMMEVKFLSEIY
jgi:hypothetical protein